MRPILVFTGAVVIWCAVSVPVRGQPRPAPSQLAVLRDLAADLRRRYQVDRQALELLAQTGGLPLRQTLADGRVMELQRLARGRLVYYITTNLNAARTLSADRVWPGGGLGFGLSGLGVTVGQWDEGPVLPTHQEFGGRVTYLDDAAGASDHATHVAGTILSDGIVATAQGMAREARLHSYNWNDDSAEMAVAAADGLALSNHSYSFVAGWQPDYSGGLWAWFGDESISATEDWLFGFYLQESADWDQIAVNGPNYLIVTSAGNDRADGGPAPGTTHLVWNASDSSWVPSNAIRNPDGDFDSLPGGMGVAKNVLVIGAVEDIPTGYGDPSDVVMTPFSAWGPTDDGRIKPDLVANGVALYSTLASPPAAYGSLSGTSMAAPNVTGSAALLQQHYRQTHGGSLPLAATLRALLIHTADEAGADPGPDFGFGWGLVNTAAAAEVILQDSLERGTIQELVLYDGGVYRAEVTSDGVAPLKVTLAWNDPPGAVLAPQLNPATAMLVNDLDVRVTRESDGQVAYPWRLDGAQPYLAAGQGDNTVDNVEQVFVPLPAPGDYTVMVTHKGPLLAGTQDFSLVITGGTFVALPAVLVWDGDSTGVDYSGAFIRDALVEAGLASVTYTTVYPPPLAGYDAVFLSFGNYGGGWDYTFFDANIADVVQTYLEGGGSLYLEGGDALGNDAFNQGANETLHHLLGLAAVTDGVYSHTVGVLAGQAATVAEGMSFAGTSQSQTAYIDIFAVGGGAAALVEAGYGAVAVQHAGALGQRTFAFSYALAGLVDGSPPSTRRELVTALLDFFLEAAPPPLTAVNDTVSTPEDSSVTIAVLANDSGPVPLTITGITEAAHGTVTLDIGDTTVTYAPENDYFGPDSFTYTVSDTATGTDTATVIVTVTPVNDPPQIVSPAAVTAVEDELFVYHGMATDVDDEVLTFSFVNRSNWLTVVGGDSVAGIPGEGETVGSFLFIALDGELSDSLPVGITIVPVNDAPLARDDSVSTPEDVPVIISVLANDTDPDQDPLTLTAVAQSSHGTVTLDEGDTTVTYAPEANYFGPDSLTYTVSDTGAVTDTATVWITVTPVNDAPGRFALLGPGFDSTIIVITPDNIGASLVFSWEPAVDVDGDSVWYRFDVSETLAAIFPGGDTAVTEVQLAYEDIVSHMRGAGVTGQLMGIWTVMASDGSDSTPADNGPFGLTLDISTLGIDGQSGVPREFALHQNYPNPFNPRTSLHFDLPRAVKVRLVVYDILGREIRQLVAGSLPAGYHQVDWDGMTSSGKPAPSGIYIALMRAPGFLQRVKLVLLR